MIHVDLLLFCYKIGD